jgi:putative peptidoglycan lipid II flippase
MIQHKNRDKPSGNSLSQAPAGRMLAMLMGGALIGKTAGFAREVLMAHVFGATLIADSIRASITAVTLPLMPLLCETVSAVLIPMHQDWDRDADAAPARLTALSIAIGLFATCLMLFIELVAPWWIELLIGRYRPEGVALVLEFTRVMALAMPFIVVYECFASAEMAVGRSQLASVRAVALSLFMIAGVLGYVASGVVAFMPWAFLAWAVTLCLWGVAYMLRSGQLDKRGLHVGLIRSTGREFTRRLSPLLGLPVIQQISIGVERFVATSLPVGTLASIDYARTLTDVTFLVVAHPIGMAVLYKGKVGGTGARPMLLAGPVLVVLLPITMFLCAFAGDIVELVFARGAFDATAAAFTRDALRGMAAGLWAASLGQILVRYLNVEGRNKLAMLVQCGATAIAIILNLLLLRLIDKTAHGAFFIGLADSARGLTLLALMAVILGCHRELGRLVLQAFPYLLGIGMLCAIIQVLPVSPFVRLLLGGAACAISVVLAAQALVPDDVRALRYRYLT